MSTVENDLKKPSERITGFRLPFWKSIVKKNEDLTGRQLSALFYLVITPTLTKS